MTDQWTGQGPAAGPGGTSGPWSTATNPGAPRRLERSSTEKMIAGVAGGLGQYFGLDPVIFRIAIVVLALAGGSGVLLYALAWALLPRQDQPRSAMQAAIERPQKGKKVIAAVIVVVGSVALLGQGEFFLVDGKLAKLLSLAAIIGAVVWLVNQDEDSGPVAPPPPPPPGSAGAGPWSPPPVVAESEPLVADEGVGPVVAGGPDWLAAGTAGDPTEPIEAPDGFENVPVTAPGAGGAGGGAGRPDDTSPFLAPAGGPAPEPPVAAGGRSLTLLVISALLVGGGVAALAGVPATVFLALALVVTGLALLSGGRWGRSRGLIPVGIVLVVALGLASAVQLVSVPLRGGAGERFSRPLTVIDLQDEYRLGVGELRLDLSGLSFFRDGDDDDVEIDASVGVGELVVTVPAGVDVVVNARAGLGQLDLFGEKAGGARVERQVVSRASTVRSARNVPTLELNLETGMGEVRVERGAV